MKSPVGWLSDGEYTALQKQERALIVATTQVGVMELGHNRGKMVEAYQRAAGVPPGTAWCASFVTWCLKEAGWDKGFPADAATVCDWREWAQRKGILTNLPSLLKRGDLFLWCNKNTWHGHIGFHIDGEQRTLGYYIRTIEGNTDGSGTSEGDGVYRRARRWGTNFEGVRLSRL